MLSREAVAKLSRALSATKPETPVQIEPAAPAKKASGEGRGNEGAEVSESRDRYKAAKKPAAKKEEKNKVESQTSPRRRRTKRWRTGFIRSFGVQSSPRKASGEGNTAHGGL